MGLFVSYGHIFFARVQEMEFVLPVGIRQQVYRPTVTVTFFSFFSFPSSI